MMSKDYSRQYEPSPIYSFRNSGVVSTTSPLLVDIGESETTSKKYLPFNNFRLCNKSACHVFIYPNQDENKKVLVPSGSIVSLNKNDVPAWWSFAVYSQSGNVNANELEVTVWSSGVTVDMISQNLHKKFSFLR